MQKQMTFFADWGKPQIIPTRPVRVLFLTSLRDVLACDCNGLDIMTADGLRFMEGVIQRTVRETSLNGALHGLLEVAGIVTDDLPKDTVGADFPLIPESGRDWIHPIDLCDMHGRILTDLTFRIPSTFRTLPLEDTAGRSRLKLEFESAVLAKMRELGADILVSDHYMAKLEHFCNGFGMFGRVLNIHPAVTLRGHPYCFRGMTPTADAIQRAQTESNVRTGSTLHFVNQIIDDGPSIAFLVGTPVYADDEPQWLRYRNYQRAKLPLFIAGMRHYVTQIYPYLGEIDLNHMKEKSL